MRVVMDEGIRIRMRIGMEVTNNQSGRRIERRRWIYSEILCEMQWNTVRDAVGEMLM